MNDMEKIKIQMELKDFKIEDILIDENNLLSHIYASKGCMYYSVIAPHKGNHFKYLLRRNPIITFDKWGNVDLEDAYNTAEDLLKNLDYKKDLEYIIFLWGSSDNE